MVYLKTDEEIELLRESSLLVSKTLAEMAKIIAPGVSTAYLDKVAEEFIRDNGALPACKGYHGYPASICASINDQVVHGIPSKDRILKDGDVITIDLCTLKNGFVGDSAYTFEVGEVSDDVKRLLQVTKSSLFEGIKWAKEGNRIGDISNAIQTYCENAGFSVVREMVGHGIGKEMHEAPEVPNYGRRGTGMMLRTGMTICIEPMVNMGAKELVFEKDGWTTRTRDGKCSAHFEHEIAIRRHGADILSDFSIIEEVLNKRA